MLDMDILTTENQKHTPNNNCLPETLCKKDYDNGIIYVGAN